MYLKFTYVVTLKGKEILFYYNFVNFVQNFERRGETFYLFMFFNLNFFINIVFNKNN